MNIRLATSNDIQNVCSFFFKYIVKGNDALCSDEFLCMFGVKAAVSRNQVIIAIEDNEIVGAVRFYRKKQVPQTSLYQFAIDNNHRGKSLLLTMLEQIRDRDIVVLCPKESQFNNYYDKTGWNILDKIREYNQWCLQKKTNFSNPF
ncbi:MAG: hypothetical protein ACD_19C00429G0055 [uncultured bacterium]|nr:MAG: hypothetical protein ACD_19C00429G0055 [uncultured bacterium]